MDTGGEGAAWGVEAACCGTQAGRRFITKSSLPASDQLSVGHALGHACVSRPTVGASTGILSSVWHARNLPCGLKTGAFGFKGTLHPRACVVSTFLPGVGEGERSGWVLRLPAPLGASDSSTERLCNNPHYYYTKSQIGRRTTELAREMMVYLCTYHALLLSAGGLAGARLCATDRLGAAGYYCGLLPVWRRGGAGGRGG